MNERNIKTVEEFVENGWRSTSPLRLVEEIISVHNETHRITDEYPYYLGQDGLKMVTTNERGETETVLINDIISRNGYLGKTEGMVFDQLEDWAKNTTEGVALWISPRFAGKYPCSKIIIHNLSYEFGTLQKTINNFAILLDADDNAVLNTLHSLFPETKNYTDIEDFRSLLIKTKPDFAIANLIKAISEIDHKVLSNNQVLDKNELRKRASFISEMILNGANQRQIAYEAQRLGLLGEHSISCPSAANKMQTFAEFTTGFFGLEDQYGPLNFSCPKCGATNTRPFGSLISNCQHCGGDVTC